MFKMSFPSQHAWGFEIWWMTFVSSEEMSMDIVLVDKLNK